MDSASFNLVLDCVAAKRLQLISNNRPETKDIKKTITLKVCSSTTTTTLPLPPPPPPLYWISLRKVNDKMLPFLTFKRNSQVPLRYTKFHICSGEEETANLFARGYTTISLVTCAIYCKSTNNICLYRCEFKSKYILTKLMKSEWNRSDDSMNGSL